MHNLFSVILLGSSSVFVSVSYFPVITVCLVFYIMIFFILSVWTFYFNIWNVIVLLVLFFVLWIYIFIENNTDTISSLNEYTSLSRTIQHCFLWFILSEACLFFSFFWASFTFNLIYSLEFNSVAYCMPTMYSYSVTSNGVLHTWLYIDLFNIILNTFLLFFSGLFANAFLMTIYNNALQWSLVYGLFTLILGFLFIWNQLWEFTLLNISISSNSFTTSMYVIDMLHFSHVNLGVGLLAVSISQASLLFATNINNINIVCTILYWHFVDVIWFFLLRVLYFDLISSPYIL